MIPASLFFNLYFIYKTSLNAFAQDKILFWVSAAAALVNLAINVLFLQKYGIYAAAVSSLISYFVLAMLTYYFERKEYDKRLNEA